MAAKKPAIRTLQPLQGKGFHVRADGDTKKGYTTLEVLSVDTTSDPVTKELLESRAVTTPMWTELKLSRLHAQLTWEHMQVHRFHIADLVGPRTPSRTSHPSVVSLNLTPPSKVGGHYAITVPDWTNGTNGTDSTRWTRQATHLLLDATLVLATRDTRAFDAQPVLQITWEDSRLSDKDDVLAPQAHLLFRYGFRPTVDDRLIWQYRFQSDSCLLSRVYRKRPQFTLDMSGPWIDEMRYLVTDEVLQKLAAGTRYQVTRENARRDATPSHDTLWARFRTYYPSFGIAPSDAPAKDDDQLWPLLEQLPALRWNISIAASD